MKNERLSGYASTKPTATRRCGGAFRPARRPILQTTVGAERTMSRPRGRHWAPSPKVSRTGVLHPKVAGRPTPALSADGVASRASLLWGSAFMCRGPSTFAVSSSTVRSDARLWKWLSARSRVFAPLGPTKRNGWTGLLHLHAWLRAVPWPSLCYPEAEKFSRD